MLRMVPVDPPYRWFSKRNWLMAKGTAVVHEVTLITGDGVGPELARAARQCVEATGVPVRWDEQEAGVDVMERLGTPLPAAGRASGRRTRCAV